MLSMTTDYACDVGSPRPYLRRIAEAGFTHVHWCHEWNTDHLYTDGQIEQIAGWLREYGLGLTDLHASAGREKAWGSPEPDRRSAGVELVGNRIDMAARLGADVIILHLPELPNDPGPADPLWGAVYRSLDELGPRARAGGVRIAIENGNFDAIETLFSRYGRDYLGLCYDSGHGNLRADGLARLEALTDRLISIHLHDNDGGSDQHRLPFTGTVDWPKLARILAASAYRKWVNLEAAMAQSPIGDEGVFLRRAFEAGTRLAEMIKQHAHQAGDA